MTSLAASSSTDHTGQPRLSACGVSVTFAGTTVLRSADLRVDGGEVVGLLGANGSGKSTMVKVLTGVYRADSGSQLQIGGRSVSLAGFGPGRAHELGVRVVHQEAPLIPTMTVADMIGLQLEFPVVGPLIKQRELEARAVDALEACEVSVDPRRRAGSLTAAERALVSLAVVLADVRPSDATLILDEATASLSTADAGRLLDRVKALAEEGLAVLMVTHRLPEIHDYCHEAVVLRDGEVVDRRASSELDDRELVRVMAGPHARPLAHGDRSTRAPESSAGVAALLEVRGLSGSGVRDIDLAIGRGEIVGVTGRDGAGELLRLIAGIERRTAGKVSTADGTEVGAGPRGALDAGIVYLSSDRLSEGGVTSMSVAENIVLPRIERFGVLGRGKAEVVADVMRLLDIRPPDPRIRFGSLSGGNQQKVLIGRWLSLNPCVLVLDDPTAGVDPATRERIFALVAESASRGVGILLRSTEPEQLARLCSRVLVVRDGVLASALTGDLVNPEEISLATYS